MATNTVTIDEYTCDLCGAVCEKDDLTQLYGRRASPMMPRDTYDPADICADCRSRPVSEVLAFFARRLEAAGTRQVQVRLERGGAVRAG